MAKPSPNRRQKAESWRKHLAAWKNSGLSQVQYCQEHHLKKNTFLYWRKKLGKGNETFSLVPVTVDEEPRPVLSGLTLCYSDRFCVELSVDFDAPSLKRLVEVLESR